MFLVLERIKLFLGLLMIFAFTGPNFAQADVNIYSYRQLDLIEPVLDAFTKKTGIKTKAIFLKKGLVERVKREGRNTRADLILTTDISRLATAKEAGIVEAVFNAQLNRRIPANLRDPEGHWFALTKRSRVIYASKDRVGDENLTYEDLADPRWQGKICIRSGQHVYNVALFASMIAVHGEEKAEGWLSGLKANLARKPNGNDRAQAKGIFSGECDLALANTYYYGLMQTNDKAPEQKEWAEAIKIIFPNAQDRGSHLNVAGMMLTKHGKNRQEAIQLMEFLVSDQAQALYAEAVFEYPVVEGLAVSPIVEAMGVLQGDKIDLARIAELSPAASKMVDRVGFNR